MNTYQIAELLNGKLEGSPDLEINNVGKIESAKEDEITFISNPLYEKFYKTTNAGAVIVSNDFDLKKPRKDITLIRVQDPYRSFLTLLEKFNDSDNIEENYAGVSDTCALGDDVLLGDDIYIGDFVRVGDKCSIGDNSKVYSNTTLENNVTIGKNCIIYPHVVIYRKCVIGDNVVIHSGTVIGCDGFGFAKQEDGTYKKIPQNGIVVIENDVEIGSNCTIDRATMGETRIGKGVKLDNQIQVAHNVTIGENTVIAAQVGIAGSAKIGKRCMIGGQSGIIGHISICDDVMIGASVGVSKSITVPGVYTGYRAKPNIENLRHEAFLKNLESLGSKLLKLLKNN